MITTGQKIVQCPACCAKATISAAKVKSTTPQLQDGWLYWEEIYLPTDFICIFCGLTLNGHALLQGAELGEQYSVSKNADPAVHFSPEEEYFEDYNNM